MMAVCLILLSVLPFFNQTYALTTYKKVTKYHLDMGVIHIWGTGNDLDSATWQDGLEYGKSYTFTNRLTFSDEVEDVVDAYVLNPSEFEWENTNIYDFNETDYLTGESTYRKNYEDFVSSNFSNVKATLSGDSTVDLSYKAKLKSDREDFNLSDRLNRGEFDYIIDLLGGKGSVKPDLYAKLEAGKNGVGNGVFGFMFFVPIVIEYQVIVRPTLTFPLPQNPTNRFL